MNQNKILNFNKALNSLEEALLNPIEKQIELAGLIKNFEFVYELSWKLLKAYLNDLGIEAYSPKEIFSKAYQAKLLDNEKVWLEIINARNLSSHTYSIDLAEELANKIKKNYIFEFRNLKKNFDKI